MIKRCLNFLLVTLFVFSTSLLIPGSSLAQTGSAPQYQVVIDHDAHQRFGLYYPVTYKFRMNSELSGLTAQYRFSQSGTGSAWANLEPKTSADFFNGVNAARFEIDYVNHFTYAYLSVAFTPTSDVIYMRVLNGVNEVTLTYQGIPQYYDNRRAAVTVTLDDWEVATNSVFNDASRILSTARVAYTVGIKTSLDPDWDLIQQWINTGYMEAASHSRTHPCSAYEYELIPPDGYEYQISGSRNDILNNLILPHEYVPVYFEPCGYTNDQIRLALISAGYLVSRAYPIPPVQNTFSDWGSDGAYQSAYYSYDTGHWGWWDGTDPDSWYAEANASFDTVYNIGGIYHLLDHPWQMHWDSPDYPLPQHIQYISNKLDVWYASFGDLYLYHYIEENDNLGGKVLVSPVTGDTAFGHYTGPVYLPNASYRFTIQVAEMGSMPPGYGVCIQYGIQGGSTSTNPCICTSPACSSGLGVWECNIPDDHSLHNVQVDWNISNWSMSGGTPACSTVSTLGPSSFFNTSPTAIKLESIHASQVRYANGVGLAALLLILFGSAWFWKISRQDSSH